MDNASAEQPSKNNEFLLPGAILLAALFVSASLFLVSGNLSKQLTDIQASNANLTTTLNEVKAAFVNNGTPNGNTNPDNTNTALASLKMSELIDDDPSVGPGTAPVVVVEFSDFECPYCGAADGRNKALEQQFGAGYDPAVPKLIALAQEGKIQFVYRDWPLSGHPQAMPAALAANCANEQGKFWEYHDKLFENFDAYYTKRILEQDANAIAPGIAEFKQFAADLGLNTTQFNSCLDGQKYASEISKDLSDVGKLIAGDDQAGTPMFFVGLRDGKPQKVGGAQPFGAFESIFKTLQ
ncbi:MAG: thioredoxin domain-containing protein [Candidatus Diapherotrites archaeon]|nr:thioredoxin domain-containing protein [Candidatus Diapherotrites archaeon]